MKLNFGFSGCRNFLFRTLRIKQSVNTLLGHVKQEPNVLTSRTSSVVWAAGRRRTSLPRPGRPPPPAPGPAAPSSQLRRRFCCWTSAAGGLRYPERAHAPSPEQHDTSSGERVTAAGRGDEEQRVEAAGSPNSQIKPADADLRCRFGRFLTVTDQKTAFLLKPG